MSTSKNNKVAEEPSLKELAKPYLKKWKWFIFIPILLGILMYLFLKTLSPQYKIESTVLIKDAKSNGSMSLLKDLSGMGGLSSDGVDNEIEIFKSKSVMKTVIKELAVETSVFKKGFFRNDEVYGQTSPILVNVLNEKPDEKFFDDPIDVKIDANTLTLSSKELEKPIKTQFGRTINLPFANIIILKNNKYDVRKTDDEYLKDLLIVLKPLEKSVRDYQGLLDVERLNKDATVISISMKYPEVEKAKDIINRVVSVYNRDALNDKNEESKKTAEFIEDRIVQVGNDLGSIEDEKESFKEKNSITDIATEAEISLKAVAEGKGKQMEIQNQLGLTNSLLSYVQKQGAYEVLPSNIGLTDNTSNTAIASYNSLVLERERLLQNATPQNPLVVEISKQINTLRPSVVQSLVKSRGALLQAIGNYQAEEQSVNQRISKFPSQEKIFRNIERNQRIKENLYLFLLQKREETQIALAVTAQKARIIDYAYASDKPVSPKKLLLLFASLLLGAAIPFGIIYLRQIFDDKIAGREDIERIASDIPVMGEVPSLEKGQNELTFLNDLSPLAESIRILNTNVLYMLPKKEESKVIFVTSSIKGEGKTFVAYNMALSLASPERKVVIIGADIRNPQLQRYNKASRGYIGLSEYLHDQEVTVNDIIRPSEGNKYCDLIYSGSIPPNPTELLTNGRTKTLVEELKQSYDYIILDTAPLMLVTDSFLISDLADLTVYVVRSKYTEKPLIEFADKTVESGKIRNVGFVLNDVSKENLGYGNKYGYGYHKTEEKNFWQRLFGR